MLTSSDCLNPVVPWSHDAKVQRHLERSGPKLMPRVYVTSRGRSGVSFGCLGSLVIGFIYLMAAVLFIGIVVAIGGIFLAALIVSLLVLAVHRLMLAVSPMTIVETDLVEVSTSTPSADQGA